MGSMTHDRAVVVHPGLREWEVMKLGYAANLMIDTAVSSFRLNTARLTRSCRQR